MKTDTIAAIATAVSESGISIIRISGDDAFDIANKIFRSKSKKKDFNEEKSHTVHYGMIVDQEEIIDEILLLIMRGPKSYTCENVVEIDCHGGILVTRKILDVIFRNGARPAEPGEFTKRAFLNGRIDLSQAESVIDIINAKNELALKSSVSQLQGIVFEEIKNIRQNILHELAFIEAALDDPEHYELDDYGKVVRKKINDSFSKVEKLLKSSENGKIIKEGIKTVIVGKPNAGKSSLLNILVGYDRAIVTDIAGTTRDILEEQIQIGGVGIQLIDTAGIHKTEDYVEKIGVSKSQAYLKEADLVLFVVDASTKLDDNDFAILRDIGEKKCIILLNKIDLDVVTTKESIGSLTNHPIIPISTVKRTGISDLEEHIVEMFFDGKISFNDEIYITNARHKHLLNEAKNSLQMVLNSIDAGMPEDFLTIDMMSAYEELGAIIGESVNDDLVDEIFSKFCMGK